MVRKKLVVIGGGAAGFFCAINAARLSPGLQVILLEKSSKLLSKVKISGGGRCNVTHACDDIPEMSKRYPRGANLVKKTFHQFFTNDTIAWFAERGVRLKTEADGRMFPVTNSSQTIVDCLLREADRYGVAIHTQHDVRDIVHSGNAFTLHVQDRDVISADYICVACGGYPKTAMFEWLTVLGHSIEEPVPSLFTFNIPGHPIRELMGISVENVIVKVATTKLEQQGPLLITHWGFSGPAILKLSAWGARELKEKNWEFLIRINWIPAYTAESVKEQLQILRSLHATQKIINKNVFGLPARLWEFIILQAGIKEPLRWADLPSRESNRLIQELCQGEYQVKGKTTFKEEFVTAGGIRLNEIDSNTMMSKKIDKLFFAGEILDVDGITGGFNFQHAWTSGFVAARSIAQSIEKSS